ncbi:MAG: hypothetical protein FJX53_10040 [Alphaproteobacteria bacterium]|nr:hypothetical protein [Alphaproteobacteria bacterium]
MSGSRGIGWLLLIAGLLVNNYAFLHDLVMWSNEGAIFMGWKTGLLAAAGVVATLAGAWMIARE